MGARISFKIVRGKSTWVRDEKYNMKSAIEKKGLKKIVNLVGVGNGFGFMCKSRPQKLIYATPEQTCSPIQRSNLINKFKLPCLMRRTQDAVFKGFHRYSGLLSLTNVWLNVNSKVAICERG